MRFSLQVHYAICGVFDLAYSGQGRPVQVRVIGERQAIPTRYLEQIFQRLRRAKLVSGKRGPGGGYVLARDAAEISLREIVEAVEGPVGGEPFAEAGAAASGSAGGVGTAGRPDFIWPELADRIGRVLDEISVSDLCRQAARRGVPRLYRVVQDYQI
ncbi:MAG: Rrf2 family transcriptional regulator [Deltaproteobacteria bacterium]|nr:Rrf2 family transcriptional regulator [Deltaproteobacteria bacterium]